MARDDCMYDYLRPSDCWTDNPWAYKISESDLILTVCEEGTEGAKPLYDAIDGCICLYTAPQKYPKEDCERFTEELKSLVILKTVVFEESDPRAAGKNTTERLTAGRIVVKDGEIIGGFVCGEQTAGTNRIIRRSVFLPLGENARETEFKYELLPSGSNGKREEHLYHTVCSLERNGI